MRFGSCLTGSKEMERAFMRLPDRRLISSLTLLGLASSPPLASDQCNRPTNREIVVCGSRSAENPYRLPKLPNKYDRKPVRAETDAIPGVHAQAHVQSERMPDGNVSKRLMLTFRVPF